MISQPMLIPRLIHHIWLGSPIPKHLSDNVNRWVDMHPGWIVNVWGDEDFDWLQNRRYFDQADRLVPADAVGQFRADIARYEILWNYGGFYADVDTYPLRPIDQALRGKTTFAAAEDKNWVGNTYLGSVPEADVFTDLIASLPNSIETHRGARPCISTGPQFLTPIWRQHNGYIAPTKQWFPYSYKDVRNDTVPMFIPEGPYACHTWDHSRQLKEAKRRR